MMKKVDLTTLTFERHTNTIRRAEIESSSICGCFY